MTLIKVAGLLSLLFKYGFVQGYCFRCFCCTNHDCDQITFNCNAGCKDGYWGDKCNKNCPKTCASCSQSYLNDYVCQLCVPGYYNGKFQDLDWLPFNWNCTHSCNTSCTSCVSYKDCTACKPGFYLNNWICRTCPGECSACTNYNICTNCQIGYYLKERQCHPCQLGCSLCGDQNICDKCRNGYYLNGNICSPCRSHCSSCSSYEWCAQCQAGYYLNYGKCVLCDSGCSYCSGSDGRCYKCIDGYYLENGICYSNACTPKCSKCTSTEHCVNCETGFYGTKCSEECSSNCERNSCDISGRCNSCGKGYYGPDCSKTCHPNCQNNKCGRITGRCFSCKVGFFFNASVCEKCPLNCKTCSSSKQCLSCVDGYKGAHCQNICTNCKQVTRCDQHDGYCYHGCKQGLTGNACEYNCSKVCKNCHQHNANKCYDCVENRFGSSSDYYNCEHSCSIHCINQACSDNTGYCTLGCVAGFWGNTCSESCSKTCIQNTCNKENGTCSTGCIGGYTGSHCKCPPNCLCDNSGNCIQCKAKYAVIKTKCQCTKEYCQDTSICNACFNTNYYALENHCCACNLNCKNGKCTFENQCLEGCEKGYFRHNCLSVCNEKDRFCVECMTGNNGDYEGCIQCQEGFYPDNRNRACQQCPSNCQISTCDSMTGKCTQGCKPGWWGDKCDKLCAYKCSLCAQNNGICTVCSDGKYLHNCSENCSANCSMVNGSHVCAIEDGNCLYGCQKNSSYGKQCERHCSSSCTDHACNWKYGHCLNGCKYNYYGSSCENKCKDTCVHEVDNRRCYESNGTCVSSCPDGYYGLMCELLCNKNCFNKTCDKQTGSCYYGCVDTFEGNTCEIAMLRGNGHENTVLFAVGGSISAVLVIIVVLVVIFLLRRRRRGKEGEENVHGSTVVRFNNDSARLMQQEQNDEAVYAKPNKPKRKTNNDSNSTDRPSLKDKSFNVFENEHVEHKIETSANVNGDVRESMYGVLEIDEDSIIAQPDLEHSKAAAEKFDESAYCNVAALKRRKVYMDKLADFVSGRMKTFFIEEFDKLPTGLIKPYTESQKRKNIAKNRYRGLYPYDRTRVVLNERDSDYINASYIDGYRKGKAYIASIGPTLKYMEDMSPFWTMIWQEQVGKIVMLTKLTEAGVPKCDKYWPDKDCSGLYGDIQVTTNSDEIYADYTIRSFLLQKVKDSKGKRNIVQVHYTAWPDKGIPDETSSLVEFRHRVNTIDSNLEGPVLVHCSAGIGRTGTYIAIDILTHEGEVEDGVDIYACVRNLREQRVNMVQTAEQYQFLHNAIVHSLTLGSKPTQASKFHEYMSDHAIHSLGYQFLQLEAFGENRSDHETEAVRLNEKLKEQNRSGADIPGDNNRPRLYLRRNKSIAGYINAVYINSYRSENRFLVAQTPLPNTVEDFLTLIVQENVSCIVSMESNLNGNETIGTYIPDDSQPLKVGSCTVLSEEAECTDQYVLRKLRILHQGKSRTQEVTVKHIQFTKWIEKRKTPDDPKLFMRFVRDVELKCDSDNKDRPILVHCLTGAGKSGLFCVVSILLEKLQIAQEISVVNTVCQVKNRRHMTIPNKEQYNFCHQCLDKYLHTFDTYSNFRLET